MTQIILTRSHNIGFVLDRRVLARRLAPEFDEGAATRQGEKISTPDNKEGRVAIQKSDAQIRINIHSDHHS